MNGNPDTTTAQPHALPTPKIHLPLSSEQEEIRLCTILPAEDFSSPIECELSHTLLDGDRQYEALSYAWGKPNFTQQIFLNGQPFYITPKLEAALRRLRFADQKRVLWIDAICIDQSNVDERKEQVQRMRRIYSRCSVDLFWMGEGTDRTRRAINIMHTLQGLHAENIKSLDWGETKELGKTGWLVPYDDMNALKYFFTWPGIWRRVWVVQEVSCAPQVRLVLGNSTLDWEIVESVLGDLHDAVDAFHGDFSHGTIRPITSIFSSVQVIKTQRRLLRDMEEGGEESSLLDVLARFKKLNATDPRDKVFALLGLVSDTLGVEVDYRRSPKEVYMDVVLRLINHSQNLDMICQSPWRIFNNSHRLPDLPSWVAGFSAPGTGAFLFAQRSIFSAGLPTCNVPCTVVESDKLVVKGICLGTVADFPGSTWRETSSSGISVASFTWSAALLWLLDKFPQDQLTSTNPPHYFTGEGYLQVFWRSMIADCTAYPMRRLTTDEIATGFAGFQRLMADQKPFDSLDVFSGNPMFHGMNSERVFSVTDTTLFAMIPCEAQKGDIITVLHGAKVPLVLRHVEDQENAKGPKTYQVVGGAYVHGYMDGEANQLEKDGSHQVTEFYIA